MLVEDEHMAMVLKKVQLVKEHKMLLCLAGDRIPVSIEDLQHTAADMYDLTIEKYEVTFDGDFVRGMMERYHDNRVRILVRADQPTNMKRFVAAKEIAHVVIDEKEDWAPDGATTIDQAIREANLPDHEAAAAAVQSELLAQMAAVELLVPWEFREADKHAVTTGKLTKRNLASHYGVPEVVIGWSFMQYDLLKEIWETANGG
ncbi:ImmA/IrrE family metallo-endopeptidase [Maricaulis sp.]|uniref:ImmA/IrrE family metallo-endopeptidase n=1 Tax=Maricaulis sp. TaxID=1486257 RepID=UPI003A95693A